MTEAYTLWRRLDTPGHDACLLQADADVWRLRGMAVFLQDGLPVQAEYEVLCGGDWLTRRGMVRGWFGNRRVEVTFERSSVGMWRMNAEDIPGLEDCVDLDLGFTPATNLVQLRRLALPVGAAASVPVAWFDLSSAGLERLDQTYERMSATEYRYAAQRFGYAATLVIDETGFVRRYPDLWELES